MKYEFIIPDMTCGHCVKTITEAIHSVAPQAVVSADPATHWLTVEAVDDAQSVMMTIQAAGYSPQWV
ncbi:heavy-metal-associated domain-containing protein [Paenalcaligenes niemegkensis]|uniref:heavy-metal-associated domain-containing protein n=1 Tax=Paenalcaligenes niemegkensis TaxID=2895469 RepID=UPI001EE8142A|nr:heavy-metal-associated domain-containing protein [Paenalcaligenes niemegkensis]MCQ9616270.1 heavy-metal-associated domain-containing protein [Paenalcaligenes niemegkensis]